MTITPLSKPPFKILDAQPAEYVALFLKEYENGQFSHADEHGRESAWPEAGQQRMGILFLDPSRKPTRHFFGLITKEPKPVLVGMLNFSGSPRAPIRGTWLFEMCTDYNRKEVFEMLDNLEAETGACINIIDEEPAVRDARLYDQMYN